MLVELLQTVCGMVKFEAANGFCERLINLCATNNIALKELKRTPEGFTATAPSYDFKEVCRLAEKVNIDIKIISRRGAWFEAVKYKGRWGIAVGAVAFLVALMISSCFIWDITVTGNKTVTDEQILLELSDLGLKSGTYAKNVDFFTLKQMVLLEIPELAWLTLNLHGSKVEVIVSERYAPPLVRETTPCDIIAKKTGQVKYMRVYSGTAVVSEGFPVIEGDILVTGKAVGLKQEEILSHSDAKIIAQVQFDKTVSVDLAQYAKKYTGKVKNRYFLGDSLSKLPLFIATKLDGKYDLTRSVAPVKLFSMELPMKITKHSYRFYDEVGEKLNQKQAETVLLEALKNYEVLELANSAIISKEIKTSVKGEIMSITASYIVEEDIAKKVAIPIS